MSSCSKAAINSVVVILLMVAIVIIANLISNNSEYDATNSQLRTTITTQKNTIEALYNENGQLKQDNENLNFDIVRIEAVNNRLQTDNNALCEQVQELTSKVKSLEEKIDKLNNDNKTNTNTNTNITTHSRKDFKSYMPYNAITNKSSKQWKLQQKATTNKDGIRCIDGVPMVAVGTGWGLKVGDVAIVNCENGNSFKVIIGDIKANAHTDKENKTTIFNGCRCEFIVEESKLNSTVKKMGNMAVLDKYKGYVVNIKKA